MKTNDKIVIITIIIFIIIILITLLIQSPDQSQEVYRLTCENAKNINEYTSCVRLDTKING